MDYLYITISIICVIAAYFVCLWGFRVLFLLAIMKIISAIKDKTLEGIKAKMGGFMDGDNSAEPKM